MKKLLLTSLIALFAVMFAGCAEESNTNAGSGTGNTPPSTEGIPGDTEILKIQVTSAGDTINITNPRDKAAYPIMINTAMGLNGEADMSAAGLGIVKGVGYDTFFSSKKMDMSNNFKVAPNLTFGVERNGWKGMYNLTDVKPLDSKQKSEYHIIINGYFTVDPKEGELVFAFLTEDEAKKYLPDNNNIKLMPETTSQAAGFKPQFLDEKTIQDLITLGAIKKYKWQSK